MRKDVILGELGIWGGGIDGDCEGVVGAITGHGSVDYLICQSLYYSTVRMECGVVRIRWGSVRMKGRGREDNAETQRARRSAERLWEAGRSG